MTAVTGLAVRRPVPGDADAVAAVMAAAFVDDPVVQRLFPRPRHRSRAVVPLFRHLFLDQYLPHGGTLVAERSGTVVGSLFSLPPGHARISLRVVARTLPRQLVIYGMRGPAAWMFNRRLEAVHVAVGRQRGPHWYGADLGVLPGLQGGGVGTALFARWLELVDAAAAAAYLEATGRRNAALYARHGFRPLDEVGVGGGVTLVPMWRPARPVPVA